MSAPNLKIDLDVVELAFGGRAFVPMTDAGRDWCTSQIQLAEAEGYAVFVAGDACMAGHPEGSIGVEPADFDGWYEAAFDDGLVMSITHSIDAEPVPNAPAPKVVREAVPEAASE